MEPNPDAITPAKTPWIRSIKLQWHPQPLIEPKINPAFTQLDPIQRSTEALRYCILRFEWWLSPSGCLREWLRFNLAATMTLGIPALLVVPLVTCLLGQFATWTALIIQIAGNLVIFPISILIGVALISGWLALKRTRQET